MYISSAQMQTEPCYGLKNMAELRGFRIKDIRFVKHLMAVLSFRVPQHPLVQVEMMYTSLKQIQQGPSCGQQPLVLPVSMRPDEKYNKPVMAVILLQDILTVLARVFMMFTLLN